MNSIYRRIIKNSPTQLSKLAFNGGIVSRIEPNLASFFTSHKNSTRCFNTYTPKFDLGTTNTQYSELNTTAFYDDEVEIPSAVKPSKTQYIFFSVNFSPTLDMKRIHEVLGSKNKLLSNLKSGLVYERLDANGNSFEAPQYILVYPFGSATFVNVDAEVRDQIISELKLFQQYSNDQLRLRYRGNNRLISPSSDLKNVLSDAPSKKKYTWNEKFMITEHHIVVQSEDLLEMTDDEPVYCRIGENDEVEVAMLDVHTVRIISSVLAKSAALKAFEEMAEGALEEARIMNRDLKDKTRFTSTEISRLVEQVAASEDFRLGIDLLIKVKEIPKKAWDKHRYYQIFLLMQNEHENEERYAEVKEILTTIIESNRFQIDLWNAFKNERLELVIIALIACELLVNIPYAKIMEFFSGLFAPAVTPKSVEQN